MSGRRVARWPLRRNRAQRRLALVTLAASVLCGWVSPVFAHIDPEPAEAPAGSGLVVGFTVEHGCDGSPTVQLDMRLPAGVTSPVPEAIDGWTSSVAGDVVTFVGGPLPDDTPQTFRIRMTLPLEPGTTVYFPFVQRCEVGEIRWIDVPTDGSGTELDEPAPAMTLTEPVAAPSTSVPVPVASTAPASTVTTTTRVPVTVEETVVATTVVATTSDGAGADIATADTTTTAGPSGVEDDDGAGGGSGGVWILVGSIVGVAGIGAVALRQSRQARRQPR